MLKNLIIILHFFYICIVSFSYPSASVRYLETNSWVFNLGSFEIAVDPVLYSPLDFGIPLLYTGKKRFINGREELKKITQSSDYVLLSQGLDDHAHTPTLQQLSKSRPNMPYICPPSAVKVLNSCGIKDKYITTIVPDETITLQKGSDTMEITATTGALVGPPWQANENGYILRLVSSKNPSSKLCSLYYEPHCMYDEAQLSKYAPVDYVITPIVAQKLPFFTLVDGGPKALKLADILKSKGILPMANGELEQTGVLSALVQTEGSEKEFKRLLSNNSQKSNINIFDIKPGVSVSLSCK